jgi:hypothetical protein
VRGLCKGLLQRFASKVCFKGLRARVCVRLLFKGLFARLLCKAFV